jgi:hypothetical protein
VLPKKKKKKKYKDSGDHVIYSSFLLKEILDFKTKAQIKYKETGCRGEKFGKWKRI